MAIGRSTRARFLSSALPVIYSGWLAASERAHVARIESLRRKLLESDGEISTIDFGAGDRDEVESSALGRVRQERLSELCRVRSKAMAECVFLFRIVRLLRPAYCLELGTGLGVTAAYIGAALLLNGSGALITIEGCPRLSQIADDNLKELDLPNVTVRAGRFQEALPAVLQQVRAFDFAYIDGHHDGDATLRYMEEIAVAGADDMAIVIDDIDWSEGMAAGWADIAQHKQVKACGTFRGMGLCFTARR